METLLPSTLVPGMVAVVSVTEKNPVPQNVFPIDAKEMIVAGTHKLYENGSVEAARLNANPLRSGRTQVDNPDLIVAEVAGANGAVIVAETAEKADEIIQAGDHADDTPAAKTADPASTRTASQRTAADQKAAEEGAKAAAAKTAADEKAKADANK